LEKQIQINKTKGKKEKPQMTQTEKQNKRKVSDFSYYFPSKAVRHDTDV